MKRRRSKSKAPMLVVRLWTHEQVQNALPYFRAIVSSLREHWLDAHKYRVDAQRLVKKPGRADRASLIAQEEAGAERSKAEDRFNDALEELMHMDVYCLDPIRGLALIPFTHAGELAWFVFDLFEAQGVASWRYHKDTLETRRPLAEALAEAQLQIAPADQPPSPTLTRGM